MSFSENLISPENEENIIEALDYFNKNFEKIIIFGIMPENITGLTLLNKKILIKHLYLQNNNN